MQAFQGVASQLYHNTCCSLLFIVASKTFYCLWNQWSFVFTFLAWFIFLGNFHQFVFTPSPVVSIVPYRIDAHQVYHQDHLGIILSASAEFCCPNGWVPWWLHSCHQPVTISLPHQPILFPPVYWVNHPLTGCLVPSFFLPSFLLMKHSWLL